MNTETTKPKPELTSQPQVGSSEWLEPLREEIRKRDKALHKMWDRKEEPDKCRIASCELNGLQLAYKLLSGSNKRVTDGARPNHDAIGWQGRAVAKDFLTHR